MFEKNKNSDWIVPKRVTIETIFGCNSKCIMCPIDKETNRKKGVMSIELFKNTIDSLSCYKKNIEMLDLYGLGEPLLDPYIFERIRYVKENDFKNIGISTNADLLDIEKQIQLLESGIDTVIFSIDGVKKGTHEAIRRGTHFEQVVNNCKSIIQMRNAGNYKTRFVIRFIRQDLNKKEWKDFKEYWLPIISKDMNDFITVFDVHSWGGKVFTKDQILKSNSIDELIEKKPCPIISEVLYILSDGQVPLCNEDWHKAIYSFGNVKNQHPIEIFNCEKFNDIRRIHKQGNKRKMTLCKDCTILYSYETKENLIPK